MLIEALRKEQLTSSATTTFPPATALSMCVMWPYPAGVTLHNPSWSPSAASKPAETALSVNATHSIPTDNKVRVELVRDWHDNVLEGIHVVGIAKAKRGPWDVDRCPLGLPLANHVESAKVTRRVEAPAVVAVERNIQNSLIFPEGALCTISMVDIPGC